MSTPATENELTELCPVKPLGHRGITYFYLSAGGELISLAAHAHTRLNILALFGGDASWLEAFFPLTHRHSRTPIGWAPQDAADWLMREAGKLGLFDSENSIRKIGVWRAGRDDLIVNAGDRILLVTGNHWAEKKPGIRIGSAIYTATSPVELPRRPIASAAEGLEVLESFRLWQLDPWGPLVLTGWVAQASLGAWLDWRAHLCLFGQHGVGKSRLANHVATILGGATHGVLNNISEAGLRQYLANEASASIFDEQEGTGATSVRSSRVIELIRLMSGGDGARIIRGTADGRAVQTTLSGAVLVAAINPPSLSPQDRSRITPLRLRPLPTGDSAVGQSGVLVMAHQRMTELSPRLRARMIDHRQRFVVIMDQYRAALLDDGYTPRVADQFSTLLAAAFVMSNDGFPTTESIHADLDLCKTPLQEASDVRGEEGEGQQCWSHLLSAPCNREGVTIGELVQALLNGTNDDLDRQLQRSGCRVMEHHGQQYLVIANLHAGLGAIFEGTQWAGRQWRTALRYLPNAESGESLPPIRFAGAKQRGTWILVNPNMFNDAPEPRDAGAQEVS